MNFLLKIYYNNDNTIIIIIIIIITIIILDRQIVKRECNALNEWI